MELGSRTVSQRCSVRRTQTTVLALKMEGGTVCQGEWTASRSWERQEVDSPLETPGGTQPCWHINYLNKLRLQWYCPPPYQNLNRDWLSPFLCWSRLWVNYWGLPLGLVSLVTTLLGLEMSVVQPWWRITSPCLKDGGKNTVQLIVAVLSPIKSPKTV